MICIFCFQAEDGIRDRSPSRGLGDVYKRQEYPRRLRPKKPKPHPCRDGMIATISHGSVAFTRSRANCRTSWSNARQAKSPLAKISCGITNDNGRKTPVAIATTTAGQLFFRLERPRQQRLDGFIDA